MKNPFKEILEHEKLPEIIKDKVIKDINLIKLSIDLADLFLVKNPDIVKTLFDETENKPTNNTGSEQTEDNNE